MALIIFMEPDKKNHIDAAPPVANIRERRRGTHLSPVKLLVIIAGSIFVVESFVMLVLSAFAPLDAWRENPIANMVIDATLLVILLSPILYYFLFRPLIRLVKELESAIAKIETLSGLLPICSYCKKIRDDKGYWNKIETYISRHSNAEFTHGICPECGKKALEEFKRGPTP